ncbi:MAG: Rieske 2Fe-2S domain-containing protein [Ignavibacteria bacterium]|nr:Rieske 2Fe-2S domain-containing protein [Ignavibacteria bacterium]
MNLKNSLPDEKWINLDLVNSFSDGSVKEILVNKTKIAITRKGNEFGVISGVCNHVG